MNNERQKETPVGEVLSEELERAVIEWHKRRLIRQKPDFKHTGERYPQRERDFMRRINSSGRGEFFAKRINSVLGKGEDFSIIFGNYINSCLQGEDTKERSKKVGESLRSLKSQEIDLVFEFFQIRRDFKNDPLKGREKLNLFLQENTGSIPEEGFLPGLFRTINNLYPTSCKS